MKMQKSKLASAFLLASVAAASGATDLDTASIDSITGLKGKLNSEEGVYKVSQPRSDIKITADHWQMPPFMGVNTWAAFAGANNNALVDGDFVVLENELQPVLKSLRKYGINIVAIHHHMTGEQPRTIFLHYWGRGPAASLAEAIKDALDNTKR
jgi:hypothetical protein